MATSAGATRPADQITFAHNSERQFARLLDFYRVEWEYEPTAFPIEWDGAGQPTQHFRPDFFLPGFGLYIEITTLYQRLVTKKNRKIRRLRELYPDVRIKILYQRDYLSLLAKYGLEPPSQMAPDPAAVERDPLLPEEPGATAPRARKAGEAAQDPVEGEAAQDPVEDQLRGSVRPAREGPGRVGEVGLAGRTASRAVGQRARERAGGAVERAAAAGRPRVVPDPPGAVPPLPADPELVRLAQVPLPAEIAQRRGPAIAERAG
ncbi:MAG TPA: hypothetical protein VFX88_14905 [Actinomycetota bacterium]|nr:hypothetical protein [Actinomycetota bacterium]